MGKVLFFGGAGFLGNVVTRHLLSAGYQVKVVDNAFRRINGLVELCDNPNFEFQRGDIVKDTDVAKAYEDDIDYVLHAAALVGLPVCERFPTLSYDVTVRGTERVCKYKPKNTPILFFGTGSIYGHIPGGKICHEGLIPHPISTYAKHKLLAEEIVLEYKNSAIYRFSTAFGLSPSLRLNLLPNEFAWSAVHERSITVFQGTFRRNFISTNDIARAVLAGMENWEKINYEVFNIGSDDANWSKCDLANKLKEITGCSVFLGDREVDPDNRNYSICFDKIRNAIGWTATDKTEDVLRQLVRAVEFIESKPTNDL